MAQGGSGGAGGVGAEMAVGMAMAQQMMNQPAASRRRAPRDRGARAGGGDGGLELLNPAQVAQMLGVAESDVLASLESGDLKGKKIGTQWRVTRSAVQAFLHT
jgi:excisionase family DNA binding protein